MRISLNRENFLIFLFFLMSLASAHGTEAFKRLITSPGSMKVKALLPRYSYWGLWDSEKHFLKGKSRSFFHSNEVLENTDVLVDPTGALRMSSLGSSYGNGSYEYTNKFAPIGNDWSVERDRNFRLTKVSALPMVSRAQLQKILLNSDVMRLQYDVAKQILGDFTPSAIYVEILTHPNASQLKHGVVSLDDLKKHLPHLVRHAEVLGTEIVSTTYQGTQMTLRLKKLGTSKGSSLPSLL